MSNRALIKGVPYSEVALSKLLRGVEGVKRCRLNVLEGIAENLDVPVSHLMVDPEAHRDAINARIPRHPVGRTLPKLSPRETSEGRKRARDEADDWPFLFWDFRIAWGDLRFWRPLLFEGKGPELTNQDVGEFFDGMMGAYNVIERLIHRDRALLPNHSCIRGLLRSSVVPGYEWMHRNFEGQNPRQTSP